MLTPTKLKVLSVLLTFSCSTCQQTNFQTSFFQGPLRLRFLDRSLEQQNTPLQPVQQSTPLQPLQLLPLQQQVGTSIPPQHQCVNSISSQQPEQTSFPSNSTPIFNYETPYKQVDTTRDLPDAFAAGIPAEDSDIVFDLLGSKPVLNSVAGTVEVANSRTWPHLKGKGLSINHYQAPPCSVGVPHFHAFADELNYIIKGSNITVGLKGPGVPWYMVKNVKAGQIIIAPKGFVHFFINLSCSEVGEAVQVFTDETSRTLTLGAVTGGIPTEILHTAFNTEASVAEELQAAHPQEAELLRQNHFCLKRCGLK